MDLESYILSPNYYIYYGTSPLEWGNFPYYQSKSDSWIYDFSFQGLIITLKWGDILILPRSTLGLFFLYHYYFNLIHTYLSHTFHTLTSLYISLRSWGWLPLDWGITIYVVFPWIFLWKPPWMAIAYQWIMFIFDSLCLWLIINHKPFSAFISDRDTPVLLCDTCDTFCFRLSWLVSYIRTLMRKEISGDWFMMMFHACLI